MITKEQAKINIQAKIDDVLERLKLLEQGIIRKPKASQGTEEERKELFKLIKGLNKNFPIASYALVAGLIIDKIDKQTIVEATGTEGVLEESAAQESVISTPPNIPDENNLEMPDVSATNTTTGNGDKVAPAKEKPKKKPAAKKASDQKVKSTPKTAATSSVKKVEPRNKKSVHEKTKAKAKAPTKVSKA